MAKLKVLEGEKQALPIDILDCLRAARVDHGKGLLAQLTEIARLTFGPGKVSPEEYFAYRLYDDDRFDMAAKREFAGEAAQNPVYQVSCHLCWWAPAYDKLLFYASLKSIGLPVPRIQAVFHPTRTYGEIPVLRDGKSIGDYLRRDMPYPFFSKPIAGRHSVGIAGVERLRKATDELVLDDGRRIAVDAFVDELSEVSQSGHLFQERLVPHGDVARLCGDRIATLRLVVLVDDGVPELFRAVWKIPAAGNMADNFWRPGNLLAAIDPENGTVERCVQGVGPAQAELDRHPDTGTTISGMRVPDWHKARELCLSAAATMPHLRLQAWDIALCDDGPVLLEVNIGGDFNLPQIAAGRGLLDERFRRFLDSCRKSPATQTKWGRTRIAPL